MSNPGPFRRARLAAIFSMAALMTTLIAAPLHAQEDNIRRWS
jgi:hypothetical protein